MPTPVVKFVLDDETLEIDPTQFMMSEAVALEEDWNISVGELQGLVQTGTPPLRVIYAMFWIAKVRSIAAKQEVTFTVAAKQLPPAGFDFNLNAFRMDATPEPPNPSPGGTRTRTTRTTRTTSAGKRAKTGSKPSGTSTSEPSPST